MSETSSERNEQRRKLLKRAAVAPAIFVLPVGTALANSSSNVCIERGFPEGSPLPTNPLPVTDTDIWVRRFEEGNDTGTAPGHYLQYDPETNTPVAYASCWNSVNPNGPRAESVTNLIIR